MSTFRFPVRARPGASRTSVGGAYDGPRGRALVVAVTAPAVDGRATEAVLRAVAEALGVRRGAVSLVAGAGSRDKLLEVDTSPSEVSPHGRRGMEGRHGMDSRVVTVRARLDGLLESSPAHRPGRAGRSGRSVPAGPSGAARRSAPDG